MTSVWVLTGWTDSGDAVGPLAFSDKPCKDTVEAYLWFYFPEEMEEFGYLNYKLNSIDLISP